MKYFIVFLLLSPNFLFSQNTEKSREGFFLGVTLGGLNANNKDAEYYNADNSKSNSIERLLSYPYNDGTSNYATLRDYLIDNVINDDFTIIEYPTGNMNYKFTYVLGAQVGYNFSNKLGAFGELGYSIVKSEGSFVIETSGDVIGNEDNTQIGNITSNENRLNIDLGLHYNFSEDKNVIPFIEGGFNINFVEVKDQEIHIGSFSRSLLITRSSITNQKEGGTGIGAFLDIGVQIKLNEKYYCNLGGKLYYQQTKLLDEKYKLNETIFLRLLF